MRMTAGEWGSVAMRANRGDCLRAVEGNRPYL
jgi:hypothetical protein